MLYTNEKVHPEKVTDRALCTFSEDAMVNGASARLGLPWVALGPGAPSVSWYYRTWQPSVFGHMVALMLHLNCPFEEESVEPVDTGRHLRLLGLGGQVKGRRQTEQKIYYGHSGASTQLCSYR